VRSKYGRCGCRVAGSLIGEAVSYSTRWGLFGAAAFFTSSSSHSFSSSSSSSVPSSCCLGLLRLPPLPSLGLLFLEGLRRFFVFSFVFFSPSELFALLFCFSLPLALPPFLSLLEELRSRFFPFAGLLVRLLRCSFLRGLLRLLLLLRLPLPFSNHFFFAVLLESLLLSEVLRPPSALLLLPEVLRPPPLLGLRSSSLSSSPLLLLLLLPEVLRPLSPGGPFPAIAGAAVQWCGYGNQPLYGYI
jgi:hypothetical protein